MDGNCRHIEPLVALETEIRALESALEFATEDREIEALGRRLDALEIEISQSEARTPAGVAVKVRRLWESIGHDAEDWDDDNYRTILRSLERLQGEFPKVACG